MKAVAILAALALFVLVLRALSNGRAATVEIDELSVSEESVRALLMQGRKIAAIKIYRELHGVDLKAAKEAVESLSSSP